MITTDHNKIQEWVEERDGRPSIVSATKNGDSGLLRIDFGEKEEGLDEISWDEFFRIFDENNLAFLYQDEAATGGLSRFFKFVDRSSVDEEEIEKGEEDETDVLEEDEEEEEEDSEGSSEEEDS